MRRRSYMRTAWFVAILHLFVGGSLGSGLVLCVESDGTQNIESPLVESCCTSTEPMAGADRIECGCEDTPVLSAATLVRSIDDGRVDLPPVALMAPVAAPSRPALIASSISSVPVRAPESVSLRTVVLLV